MHILDFRSWILATFVLTSFLFWSFSIKNMSALYSFSFYKQQLCDIQFFFMVVSTKAFLWVFVDIRSSLLFHAALDYGDFVGCFFYQAILLMAFWKHLDYFWRHHGRCVIRYIYVRAVDKKRRRALRIYSHTVITMFEFYCLETIKLKLVLDEKLDVLVGKS